MSTRSTPWEPGTPCWVDLNSPDPTTANGFYGALFGWDAPEGPPETGGYRVAMVGDRPVAGIGPAQNPGPPVWATYVAVESADAAAEKVTAAGGQVIVPPFDVLDVGRMAVAGDPNGAVFSLWQPLQHQGIGAAGDTGEPEDVLVGVVADEVADHASDVPDDLPPRILKALKGKKK